MEKMRYKPSDKVRIKSLDWYNRQKNETEVKWKYYSFSCHMTKYCGQIMTISIVGGYSYSMIEDDGAYSWTDEMIEGLVEEETTSDKVVEEAKTYWDSIKDAWICPDGYIFKDENGNVINATKIVLEKKKKEYPKTLGECRAILGMMSEYGAFNYKANLITTFMSLLICRDAYWKIAGEEMGLGKPWKPDWIDGELKWCMSYSGNYIEFDQYKSKHHTLAFPTKEMRDAFYENFKEMINQCKELL